VIDELKPSRRDGREKLNRGTAPAFRAEAPLASKKNHSSKGILLQKREKEGGKIVPPPPKKRHLYLFDRGGTTYDAPQKGKKGGLRSTRGGGGFLPLRKEEELRRV